jgi:uncharacterized membrane protein YdjX (TVP38/TMEM64 family)
VSPRARLALLAGTLAALFVAVGLSGVVDEDAVRARVDAFGPLAPIAFVPVAVVLGLLLVPGALLATVGGVLFGPVVGTLASLTAATINAVLALLIARRTGRAGVEDLSGPRLRAFTAAVRRRGTLAVVAQRLAPAVPDGPMSYVAGTLGLTAAQIALGTLVGSAPRALSYTVLGSSLDDPTSPAGYAGAAGLVLTAVLGLVVLRRFVGSDRRPT